ncbi:helix-turn-helix domain-containing protein [Rhodococcus sp. T2V]|uniref:PucR family transcriptional regulator n=1 Tax=Rhodococcus sp. T2V TaxID=3034164 RepID=UPI0023E10A9A|nr:PucR family transcriptional regulator [Rhodococcus sp. T2V]MDF3313264.1 helix-turn-helix domain-containing protein [Rhodococcus sp. T2V]
MATVEGRWVSQLKVGDSKRIQSVCSTELLELAAGQVGWEALDWAVAVGKELAQRCVEIFPEFGDRPAQVATVRLGTESAAIITMLAIDGHDFQMPEINDDTVRAIQEWVQRGVSLLTIWAAVRKGHQWLADEYMRACMEMVPGEEQPVQLQLISQVLLRFIDGFSEAIGREYETEYGRWMTTTAAAREQVVRALLGHEGYDISSAEKELQYSLAHSHHIGLILWSDTNDLRRNSRLNKIADTALRACGAEQVLLIPHGQSTLYAWGNHPRSTFPRHVDVDLDGDAPVRVVIGRAHEGLAGFIRTHHEAQQARVVLDALPGLRKRSVDFADVHLLSVLVQDMEKARGFLEAELGELAADDPQSLTLRQTAEAYLRLKHSPLAVANELYVVRNTVIYRLKKIEQLIGHSLDERALETWTALVLKDGITACADHP